jgi:hypothetical protein
MYLKLLRVTLTKGVAFSQRVQAQAHRECKHKLEESAEAQQ